MFTGTLTSQEDDIWFKNNVGKQMHKRFVTPETMVRDKKGLRNHCVVSDMTSMSRYTYTDRGMSAK